MRKVEVALDVRANLGECPRWDEKKQLLYWVDINEGQLHCFNPATGADEFLQFNEEIGCFSLRPENGFVLGMRSGFQLLDGWNTELTPIVDPEADLSSNRFNDGRCDAKGRFIAGSVYPPKDRDGANLWSLGLDMDAVQLAEGLLTSNGAAFSPDNTVFYFSDTPKHVIYRYDYDLETGGISNGEVFHQFPHGNGRPDGAAVDSEGCYWTALYEGGRIARLSPEGEIVEEITIPARCPTMVAFGGEDMKTLYITTVGNRPEEELEEYPHSGAIFRVDVDVPGLVEHRFCK
ncbi:SMP-30/gluconolactonase/LRE family protein [Teredinibacter sp. KSP-S5-2]|uniref:SMP-30/gluconolactonase/LRE family protein n=1 Tax=Teredinibacter sp. KSP-S5-2 TaxID=3034506 RepID=UPI0029352C7E|nr:SMP-30/gluconolactonase/LRE family protein [Teredinibacter sp. KSP-S5-2]WNO08729.1 SMP-30/gluconolactonase/LRE family protein [Teredinibacter sp. KSP-S5-2]